MLVSTEALGRSHGRAQHGGPAQRVHAQHERLHAPRGAHRACHRVRNVVELEIEEDGQAALGQRRDAVGAVRGDELETELDAANLALELVGEPERDAPLHGVEGAQEARPDRGRIHSRFSRRLAVRRGSYPSLARSVP